MGADHGGPGRPHHPPLPGPGRHVGQSRPGRGGLPVLAVHGAHGPLPPALGAPHPRLPDLRGCLHRGLPHAPLPRRRRLAALAPHRVHAQRRGPVAAAGAAAGAAPGGDRARAAAAAALGGARGACAVGVVVRRAGVAHARGRRVLRGHGVVPARPAHAVHGRVRGRRVPPQALRAPHAQPRRRQVRQECHETVNDVLVGVTNAGLSRYYFRKTGDASNEKEKSKKNVRVRSALLVNIRKTPGLHALAEMMDSSKHNSAKWGNLIGYIILPFHIAMHDDPLEYIRQGKRTAERKKTSLEAVFTYWSGNLIVKLFGMKAAAALCYGMFINTTMSFSSMVGPAEKVEFYGHPIIYIAPSVYGHPHALTVHYQSYMNSIKLVLAVDDAQFPDSHQLLDDFAESLRLIRQAASTR